MSSALLAASAAAQLPRRRTAASAPADPAVVDAERPDLVILDVRVPATFTDEGVRAARANAAVLVLSQHIETQAVSLVAAGGFGYLLKDGVLAAVEFLSHRRARCRWRIHPQPRGCREPRDTHWHRRAFPDHRGRARGVRAHGTGTNPAIAESLVVTERTVEAHIGRILSKLDITDADGPRRVLGGLKYLREAEGADTWRGWAYADATSIGRDAVWAASFRAHTAYLSRAA